MKRAPKPTRRLRKTIAGAIEQGRSALRSTWGQLTIEAAWSLRMGARPAARRTPEEWALYRLRVQNVLLSVGGEA